MKRHTAIWIAAFLIIAIIDLMAVVLAISFWHDLTRSWEGNVNDYVIILFGGSFYLVVVLALDLVIFWGAEGLIAKEMEKCNTCGKPLWLPIGADHALCALRHHPFRSAYGWILVICGQFLKLVRCRRAARRFEEKEILLKQQIREEAVKKGLWKGDE